MHGRYSTVGGSLVGVAAVAFIVGRATLSAVPAATPASSRGEVSASVRDAIAQEVQKQLGASLKTEVKAQLDALVAETSRDARENSLYSTLLTLRSQLELYKIQHNDTYPTMAELANWSVLLGRTDALGKISAKAPFGPYLQCAPMNSFTGKTLVQASDQLSADAGWSWDEKTGTLRGVLPAARKSDWAAGHEDDIEFTK